MTVAPVWAALLTGDADAQGRGTPGEEVRDATGRVRNLWFGDLEEGGSAAEMLDALEAVGGPEARARVVPRPDQRVMDIVCSWPGEFDVERTLSLGFRPDSSFEAAVRQFHREFVA